MAESLLYVWDRGFTRRFLLRKLPDSLKVLFVTLGSIGAVVVASLIISIIQFQSRLAEARTQNANITFESIQLIADYQGYITQLYASMRARNEELAPLRLDYFDRFNATQKLVVSLFNALDPQRYDECYTRISGLIHSNDARLDSVVSELKRDVADPKIDAFVRTSTESLKNIVAGGQFFSLQTKYLALQKLVKSQCESLTLYVSDRLASSSLLAVSPELRSTITVQCTLGGLSDGTANAVQNPPASTPVSPQADVRQPAETRNETQGVNRLLLSELVFYYKFYNGLTSIFGPFVKPFILSPPEFIIILLVISTGILGSFLFHTYSMFSTGPTAAFPPFSAILLRATLGVMCALVIFILMRTGFVAITEGQHREGAAAISPFVVAFISVAAGLLAEPAMERIKNVGLLAIRSGGAPNGNQGQAEPANQGEATPAPRDTNDKKAGEPAPQAKGKDAGQGDGNAS
jgi:hypothetical protein